MPWYAYVHKSDGKPWGEPIELTYKEAQEYKNDTDKFMGKKGYEFKQVNKMKEHETKIDSNFHDDFHDDDNKRRLANGHYDPDKVYLDLAYRYGNLSGKKIRHAGC